MSKEKAAEQGQAPEIEQGQAPEEEAQKEEATDEKAQDAPAGEPAEVTDSHGYPGVNRDKYQRDIKERDERIAALEAQLEEKAKTEQGREEVKRELEALKTSFADEKLTMQLEMAGCKSPKAAKALLEDHGGDVGKLKEAEPWLFEETKPSGSTGLKPSGNAKAAKVAEIRKALGTDKYAKEQ